jgi:hypothetical protein
LEKQVAELRREVAEARLALTPARFARAFEREPSPSAMVH